MAYTSPKIKVERSGIAEKGVFTKKTIKRGEMVCNFEGSRGKIYSAQERIKNPRKWADYDIQIDENLFFGATKNSELELCDYINHSCDPNCGIEGSLKIVAMRNIEKGEELTFDYAMSESHHFRVKCNCNRVICRKVVTGDDWRKKEVRKRYDGYFSEYLQRKIDESRKKNRKHLLI